ncbi:hypothetical protein GCM10009111_34500 [Colwellia asteriadis]|uniref:Uncharacterized protein n=1 Tax=Colwellia asteriadis TaxID=517723 RepID=A0ABN1LBD8_9GAMM
MDDTKRTKIIVNSAYGFITCACYLFLVTVIYGKPYGRLVLFTVIPLYSLYYVLIYRKICLNYDDEMKRISAFGLIGRGTLVGSIYYLCVFLLCVFILLLSAIAFNL